MTLSDSEQLLLEMINRARLDPLAEAALHGIDLNAGLEPGTLTGVPRQALAPNALLDSAAEGHSGWMLDTDTFGHIGSGGSTTQQRLRDAGYVFCDRWLSGENISLRGETEGLDPEAAIRNDHHSDLFLSESHRVTMLNADYREVGLAQVVGLYTSDGLEYHASMVTEDFAASGSAVFVTGVAYRDADADGFYSIGEGQAGLAVTVAGAGQTVTAAAGGYEVLASRAITPVAASIGGISVRIDLSRGNVKLDLVDGVHLATSGSLTLVEGAASVGALGVGDIAITGHGGADVLRGNSGDNMLDGGGGDDTLHGGAGDDTLVGGAGNDLAVLRVAHTAVSLAMTGAGAVAVTSAQGRDILSGIERIRFDDRLVEVKTLGIGGGTQTGSAGDDLMIGSVGDDRMSGQGARDILSGFSGDDVLVGETLQTGLVPTEAGQVWRLYQSALGRAPDIAGHLGWTERLVVGSHTLEEVAAAFVTSREFAQRFGGTTDSEAFVTLLYDNVLGRLPDPTGFANWTRSLDTGARSPAQLVVAFSESAENRARVQDAVTATLEARTDAVWSDDVFRTYQATLGRAPDSGGFAQWCARMGDGLALSDVVSGFVASAEFRSRYAGAADNGAFVELIYSNVLGRAPDPTGLANWTQRLDEGWTRAEVIQGFSQSGEFVKRSAAGLESWMRGLGVDDVLDGGAGQNLLVGGLYSDTFVFNAQDGGTQRVSDLEPWDTLHFVNFGYDTVAEVRAHLTQSGSDVIFADDGVTVRLEHTVLGGIDDDMILI